LFRALNFPVKVQSSTGDGSKFQDKPKLHAPPKGHSEMVGKAVSKESLGVLSFRECLALDVLSKVQIHGMELTIAS
jgi:hypothetical protein